MLQRLKEIGLGKICSALLGFLGWGALAVLVLTIKAEQGKVSQVSLATNNVASIKTETTTNYVYLVRRVKPYQWLMHTNGEIGFKAEAAPFPVLYIHTMLISNEFQGVYKLYSTQNVSPAEMKKHFDDGWEDVFRLIPSTTNTVNQTWVERQ